MGSDITVRRKKFEFSKLLVMAICGLCFYFVCWCMWAMGRTGDLSPIAYLAPSLSGVLATVAIGYFSRAKAKDIADLQYEKTKQMSRLKRQYGEDFHLYTDNTGDNGFTGG